MALANNTDAPVASSSRTGIERDQSLSAVVTQLSSPTTRTLEVASHLNQPYYRMWVELNKTVQDGHIQRARTTTGEVHFAPLDADLSHLNIASRTIPDSIRGLSGSTFDTVQAPAAPQTVNTIDTRLDRITAYEMYWWACDLVRFYTPIYRESDCSVRDDELAPLARAYLASKSARDYWCERIQDEPETFRAYRNTFGCPAFDHVKKTSSDLSFLDADDDPIYLTPGTSIPTGTPGDDGEYQLTPPESLQAEHAEMQDNTEAVTDTNEPLTKTVSVDISLTMDVSIDADIDEDDIDITIN